MPIHRGPRLTDLISRLSYRAMPVAANVYQTWPNLAAGLSVTPAASPGGSWVEFISAASAPAVPFTVAFVCHVGNGFNSSITVEVGVGAAGAEVVRSSMSMVGIGSTTGRGARSVPTPLPIIPGGSRVSLRAISGVVAAADLKIVSAILPSRLDPLSTLRFATMFSTWYPGTTAMTGFGDSALSGAIWTYGAFQEVWAAAVEASPVIITGISGIQRVNQGQAAFATGAAGSEVVWGEFPIATAAADSGLHFELPVPLIVPGTTRHSCKYASASAADNLSYPGLSFIKGAFMP